MSTFLSTKFLINFWESIFRPIDYPKIQFSEIPRFCQYFLSENLSTFFVNKSNIFSRSKSEGYLSVKLLTSFKKIKKLTRDWRVTAHALKRSNLVELSGDGHRVKRHAHLPDNLRRGRTMTSILAIRVPEDWATLESITNLFSTYGNITLGKCYVIFPLRNVFRKLVKNYSFLIF